jgi:hypothetical protein
MTLASCTDHSHEMKRLMPSNFSMWSANQMSSRHNPTLTQMVCHDCVFPFVFAYKVDRLGRRRGNMLSAQLINPPSLRKSQRGRRLRGRANSLMAVTSVLHGLPTGIFSHTCTPTCEYPHIFPRVRVLSRVLYYLPTGYLVPVPMAGNPRVSLIFYCTMYD